MAYCFFGLSEGHRGLTQSWLWLPIRMEIYTAPRKPGGAGYDECGSGRGTIFEIKPPTVTGGHLVYSVFYRFGELSATDGVEPVSPLILDASGNLCGSTWFGGAPGWGTGFELSPPAVQDDAWTETILYNFTRSDQSIGLGAALLFDLQGSLYREACMARVRERSMPAAVFSSSARRLRKEQLGPINYFIVFQGIPARYGVRC
jgi:hypothetical protein